MTLEFKTSTTAPAKVAATSAPSPNRDAKQAPMAASTTAPAPTSTAAVKGR